jgi:hypothetical protein
VFLSGIQQVTKDGERVDKADADGNFAPIRLELGPGISADATNDGSGLSTVKINVDSSTGVALANHAAFRALAPGDLLDGEIITFQTPPGTFVYSTTTGAGYADDDNTILKLTAISSGSNGRAYNVNASPVLPTIAALRLAVSGQQPAVHVQNYAVVGDGGGGIFDFDGDDVTSADDGGTVIVASTRRYKRRYEIGKPVNVQWFGARAAASDNTVAFNYAIACANRTKAYVEIPAANSTYVFTTTVPLTVLKGALGMIGVGTGRAALQFNLDGDCLIFRGAYKRIGHFFIVNRFNTDYSARSTPVRLINGPYTVIENLESDCENNSVSCLLIEQSYDGVSLTNATNTSPIVITTSAARPWETGDVVFVGAASGGSRVLGNTAANGVWTVTRIDSTHFSLDGSTGNGTYTAATGVAAYGEDANLLCHVGAWYIQIYNPILNYITAGLGSPTGYGLDCRVNANAQGVVDPPQQFSGTYTGTIAHVDVFNINTEQKERGVSLSLATHVSFYGGQFLGSTTQAYGRNSQVVNFVNTYHNQWVGSKCFDFDTVSCRIINLINPTFQHTGAPVAIGDLGELGTGQGDIADDTSATAGFWRRGGWYRPDRSGYGLNTTNSANTYENDTHTFQNIANTGSGDINFFDITVNRVAGGILKVHKSGSGGSAWFTSGFYYSPDGASVRLALGNIGTPHQLIGGVQWYNDSSQLKGEFINSTGKFDYYVGITTDLIEEHTADAGVTIDGVLCKDNGVVASGQAKAGSLCATGVITAPDGSTTALALSNSPNTAPHDIFGDSQNVPAGGTEHVVNRSGVRPIVQTTDGTTSTDIANISIPDGMVGEIELLVNAKYNTGAGGAAGDRAKFHRVASFEHRGATQTVDTPDTIGTDKNTPGYTLFSIDMSGGNVRVFVKGGASATVDWGVSFHVRGITP